MTLDPQRLTHGASSRLARALLSHAREDGGGELVRRAAHRAAEQALAGSLAAAPGISSFLPSSLAKWLGVGVAVGLVGGGLAVFASRSDVAPPVAEQRSIPTASARRDVSEPKATPFEELSLASASTAAGGRRSPAKPPAPEGLEREIRILDRVGQAITSGKPELALRELDEHAGDFRILAPEAQSRRIEALYASGRRDEGDAFANRFLSTYGTSPLAARVRALRDAHAPGAAIP